MKIYTLIFLITLCISSTAQAEEVVAITYNTGLMKTGPINITPCVDERTQPQADAIFKNDDLNILKSKKSFVLGLQEVWTKKGFDTYKKLADKHKLSVFPESFDKIKQNGQMVISNLKFIQKGFLSFSYDQYAKKGILHVKAIGANGKKFIFANIHTGYSKSKETIKQHKKHFLEVSKFAQSIKLPLIISGDFNIGPNLTFNTEEKNLVKDLWSGKNGLITLLKKQNLKLVNNSQDITWDGTKNKIASKATWFVKIFNKLSFQFSKWGNDRSTLDHIFASKSIDILSTTIGLNKPKKLTWGCYSRLEDGKTYLSDHYAVRAHLKIN